MPKSPLPESKDGLDVNFSDPLLPFPITPSLSSYQIKEDNLPEVFAKYLTRRLGYIVLPDSVLFAPDYETFYSGLLGRWKERFPLASILSVRGCAPWIAPHVSQWIPMDEATQRPSPAFLEGKHPLKANDLLLLSHPLFPWGSLPHLNEIEALGDLIYSRGAFVVWDEGDALTFRVSAGTLSRLSPAMGCPDRTILVDSLRRRVFSPKDLILASVGRHKDLDFLKQNPRGNPTTPQCDLVATTIAAYSFTYMSISCEYVTRIARLVHALRLYAHRQLQPLTKTLVLPQGGPSIMVPFPSFKLKAAAKLGLTLADPSVYGVRGYLPLFLTDFDGHQVLKEAPAPMICKPEVLEEWVRAWAPKIARGIEGLRILLTTTPPSTEETA
jgi:hypothetical protein